MMLDPKSAAAKVKRQSNEKGDGTSKENASREDKKQAKKAAREEKKRAAAEKRQQKAAERQAKLDALKEQKRLRDEERRREEEEARQARIAEVVGEKSEKELIAELILETRDLYNKLVDIEDEVSSIRWNMSD